MGTVPTAYTWTVGELVSATKMNTYLRDMAAFLLARPYAALKHSTTQSITDSTNTAQLFNTEDADTDGAHSTVTNTSRFTCQTAGVYGFTTSIPWANNTTGKRELFLRVNGTTDYATAAITAGSNVKVALAVSDRIQLSVGDYVEAIVWHNVGSAINTDNTFHGGQRMTSIWERT